MMKRVNRIAALLAAAVLALGLSACAGEGGGGESDPLKAAMANLDAAKSMDACMVMEMDMEANGEKLESVTTMDTSVFTDPMRMKVDLTMDMGAYGSVTNSIYAESDGGSGYTMYLFDGSSWASQAATEDDLAMYDVSGSIDGYIDSVTAFSQTGEEQVDGVDTYKYTGAISGEAMENVVKESGALDSLGDLGLDESQMNEMLSGLGDISVSLWISKDDPYPVRCEMDMTAIMDGLMQNMVTAMGGAESGVTMSIPKMLFTITCSNFNSATDFEIPAEAKA
ncbi:MAG: hypothetical protein HFF80_08265 [Oscillospiraceae bacterium]|jgi:hypothetical protein|nr:hypothetical protein [Oscillospiraceae bacterium]